MSLNFEKIPNYLKKNGLFCCWRFEEINDRKAKIPYNPATGERASTNDPATFATYVQAQDALRRGSYDGIGVLVTGAIAAIDIDHCIANGQPSDMARDILDTMDAYAERSPSREGIRIVCLAKDFRYDKERYYINNHRIGLEVYTAGNIPHYVTVTGDVLDFFQRDTLEERGDQLRAVLNKYMQRPAPQGAPTPLPGGGCSVLSDAEVIDKAHHARNGAQFQRLWSGDFSDYVSRSEADLALCNQLAFWTRRNSDQMDRLFRQSGLMRDKWDRRQSGSTYGAITIQQAINGCQSVYEAPPSRSAEAGGYASPPADWEAPPPETLETLVPPPANLDAPPPPEALEELLPPPADWEALPPADWEALPPPEALDELLPPPADWETLDELVPPPADWDAPPPPDEAAPLEAQAPDTPPDRTIRVGQLAIVRGSDIPNDPPRWLLKPYLQIGKGTLLQADNGTGKTAFACAIAALVSTGSPLLGLPVEEAGNVVICSVEDDLPVLRGRVQASGGDLDRCYFVSDASGLTLRSADLEKTVRKFNAKLLILDPIQAFLGSGIDMNRANETRPVLASLFAMCKRVGCACIIIAHTGKASADKSMVNRSLGSVDIPAAMRSILHICRNPDDKDERIAIHAKCSNAAMGQSIHYRIGDQGGVQWMELSDLTEDDLLQMARHPNRQKAVPYEQEPLVQVFNQLITERPGGGFWSYTELKDKGTKILGFPPYDGLRDLRSKIDDLSKDLIQRDGLLVCYGQSGRSRSKGITIQRYSVPDGYQIRMEGFD